MLSTPFFVFGEGWGYEYASSPFATCVFLGEYPRENEGEKPSLVGMVNECHEVGKDGLERGSNWCPGFLQAPRDW